MFLMGDIERNCLLCSPVYIPCIPADNDVGHADDGDDGNGERGNDNGDADEHDVEITLLRT